MAVQTRLFFHSAFTRTSQGGTFPATATTRSASTPNANTYVAPPAVLDNISAPVGHGITGSYYSDIAGTTAQNSLVDMFTTPPIVGLRSIPAIAAGPSAYVLNGASTRDVLTNGFWVNGFVIYVWRPSNGTLVGMLHDGAVDQLGTVTTPAGVAGGTSWRVVRFNTAGLAVNNILDGDVIIIEMWARWTNTVTDPGTYVQGLGIDGGSDIDSAVINSVGTDPQTNIAVPTTNPIQFLDQAVGGALGSMDSNMMAPSRQVVMVPSGPRPGGKTY